MEKIIFDTEKALKAKDFKEEHVKSKKNENAVPELMTETVFEISLSEFLYN